MAESGPRGCVPYPGPAAVSRLVTLAPPPPLSAIVFVVIGGAPVCFPAAFDAL